MEKKTSIIYEPRGRAKEYSPLAANLYRGCGHGCLYCYAPRCLFVDKNSFHAEPTPRKNVLKLLAEDCEKLEIRNERILLCFTCDPYQPLDEKEAVTREAIKLLKQYGLPFQVLTKGGIRAARDFDLYGAGDAFATTLTFRDDARSLKYEPGAALPAERIAAIRAAKEAGIETWVSFEPVLDDRDVLALIEETAEFVDLYKVGKVSQFHPAVEIDWNGFAERVVAKLKGMGKPYYIKDDLKKHLIQRQNELKFV